MDSSLILTEICVLLYVGSRGEPIEFFTVVFTLFSSNLQRLKDVAGEAYYPLLEDE